MVIDTSALIAYLEQEPIAARIEGALLNASHLLISRGYGGRDWRWLALRGVGSERTVIRPD